MLNRLNDRVSDDWFGMDMSKADRYRSRMGYICEKNGIDLYKMTDLMFQDKILGDIQEAARGLEPLAHLMSLGREVMEKAKLELEEVVRGKETALSEKRNSRERIGSSMDYRKQTYEMLEEQRLTTISHAEEIIAECQRLMTDYLNIIISDMQHLIGLTISLTPRSTKGIKVMYAE